MTSKNLQETLLGLWHGDVEEVMEDLDGTAAFSFSDAGILTNDDGFVLCFPDGKQFQISIVRSM